MKILTVIIIFNYSSVITIIIWIHPVLRREKTHIQQKIGSPETRTNEHYLLILLQCLACLEDLEIIL